MQTKLLEIEYFFILFSLSFRKIINNKGIAKKETKKKKKNKRRTKNPYHKIQIKTSFSYESTKVRNERLCACICVHVYVNVYVKPEVGSNWLVKRQNMQTEISTRE